MILWRATACLTGLHYPPTGTYRSYSPVVYSYHTPSWHQFVFAKVAPVVVVVVAAVVVVSLPAVLQLYRLCLVQSDPSPFVYNIICVVTSSVASRVRLCMGSYSVITHAFAAYFQCMKSLLPSPIYCMLPCCAYILYVRTCTLRASL